VASFERVDVNEAQRKIEFRFHPGASVLIAIGKAEDIQVARMVENALTGEEVASNRGSSSSFSSQLRKIGDAASHPGGASVGSAAKPELSVETFPLKFASLGSAGQAAFALLTDSRSKVINDERANTLVVVATKPELSAIKKAIEQIDHGSKPFVGDNPAGPSAQPR
jgi:type II secretory pathway component GspD/PulD (secretin)